MPLVLRGPLTLEDDRLIHDLPIVARGKIRILAWVHSHKLRFRRVRSMLFEGYYVDESGGCYYVTA